MKKGEMPSSLEIREVCKLQSYSNPQSYPEALDPSTFDIKACCLGALGGKENKENTRKENVILF